MSKRVLIQAGHVGASPPSGAPGEAAWTLQAALAIADNLETAGIGCVVLHDWLNQKPPASVATDANLFLAIHYDAAVYGAGKNTGCFADRAAADPMAAASDRFIREWEALYPAATGIPLHNERRNPNTWDYYAFRDTTADTPGVLLECGVGAPTGTGGYPPGQDAAYLRDHLDEVARCIAVATLHFLVPEEEPIDVVIPDELARLNQELQAVTAERDQLQGVNKTLGEQLAEKDRLLQQADSAAGAWQEEAQKRQQRLDALQHDVLQPLQDQLESLRRQLDLASHRSAKEVVVVLDDGTSQRFTPAPNGGNGGG